jgi:hypothetical protein
MIVLCCPANLWPATAESLRRIAPETRIIPISAGDIEQPWTTYARFWGGPDDLLIIEQDIVIHDAVIPSLEACLEPWCLFPARHYAQGGGWMLDGFMCNRFRREFMAAVPVEAIEAIPASCPRCKGTNGKCWAHLDGRPR